MQLPFGSEPVGPISKIRQTVPALFSCVQKKERSRTFIQNKGINFAAAAKGRFKRYALLVG